MDLPTKISIGALVVSIVTGIFGAFGGVPGIKALFFNKPKIIIEGFMPAVVYDEGNNEHPIYPKFTLSGIIKIFNPNSFDISLNEIKLYGRTEDSSGKYKYHGKPVFYELNIPGTFEQGSGIIIKYSTGFLKCNFAHFENEEQPGFMYHPMKGGLTEDQKTLLFHIYIPSFNQLLKFNEKRIPYELVPEVYNGKLTFAIVFDNQLYKIAPKRITKLNSFSKEQWEDMHRVITSYNAQLNLFGQ